MKSADLKNQGSSDDIYSFRESQFPKDSKIRGRNTTSPSHSKLPKTKGRNLGFLVPQNRRSKSRSSLFSKIPSTHKFGFWHSDNPSFLRFQSPNNKGRNPKNSTLSGPLKTEARHSENLSSQSPFRGTSLIAKHFPLEPCTRHTPMVLRRSEGGGVSHERGTPAKQETKGRAPRSLPPE